MALTITNAILHVVSNYPQGCLFSNQELDIDSETSYEYIGRHLRRLLNNPAAKEATFTAQSGVYFDVTTYQAGRMTFKELSLSLCRRLAEIMERNKEIPPADVLVVAFENRKRNYLAMIKLNYGECFTHHVLETEGGVENHIVKNTVVLPVQAGKVEEACLIPMDEMVLRIFEKSYPVEGDVLYYFSGLFLECETTISKKEAADIIQEVAGEITAKYYGNGMEASSKLKCAMLEEAEQLEDETDFVLENVVANAFEEKHIQEEFLGLAKTYGLPPRPPLDKAVVNRTFKMESFKADNGVEIKFPAELSQNPDAVQIVTNSDGTVSITLKNLKKSD